MRLIESEIERRIELLKTLPSIRENGWIISVSCQWISTRVKVVSVTILTGCYHNHVMTGARDSEDVWEAVDKAFNYITERLTESYANRDTGVTGMAMDLGA